MNIIILLKSCIIIFLNDYKNVFYILGKYIFQKLNLQNYRNNNVLDL